jgi:VRR-NUC domain.
MIDEPLEKDIQRAICDWLAYNRYFFWRSNNVPVYSRSNDGIKRFRSLPKYTPKGIPDIMVLHEGKYIALEVKRPSAKLRPEQAEFGAKVTLAGGLYHIVHSIDEVKEVFHII